MKLAKLIAGAAAALVALEGAHAVASGLQGSTLLRPPGSQGERDFIARCTKCGRCIQACPYKALHAAGAEQGAASGTPFIDPERQACRMCADFPCVAACPTDALRDVEEPEDVEMGYALIDEEACIAFRGLRCEVCYRVCPLIDQAIFLQFGDIDNDNIHTKFMPTIDASVCTGCGLCVQRCVVREPKVPIRIVSRAEQEKSDS